MTANNKSNIDKSTYDISARELSRLAAIMAIYSLKTEGQNKQEVISHIKDDKSWMSALDYDCSFPEMNNVLFQDIVDGVLDKIAIINNFISKNINNKKIDINKLDILLLSIIQCGTWELLTGKVEPNIIMAQYTFLSGCFFDQQAVAIVNAVLSSITVDIATSKV